MTAIVTGWGAELDQVCESLRATYTEIWKIAREPLAYPNAELVRQALASVVPAGSIVLVPHAHFGVDLSPGLAIKLDAAYLPDVVDVEGVEGRWLKAVRQEFGGLISARMRCDISTGAVLNIRPGSFRPMESAPAGGHIVDHSAEVGTLTSRRRYLETIAAEVGDVDITREAVLVSIGRGIGEQENIAIAEDLAEAMGAAVSCSRPVVDAKWMEKSRQVGSSGKTVRPKVYMACGISGSFQHLAGLKGNPFLVAINKNPKAPIFRVADVGIVDDILEFMPALADRVREEARSRTEARYRPMITAKTLKLSVKSLREFAKKRLTDEELIALDERDECPLDIVRHMCSPDKLGIQLLFIPEEFGGFGGGAFDVYCVCEEMARIDLGVATAVLATFLGSDPITVGATPEQKKIWLSRIADEGLLFAYGATEPDAGSDLGALQTTADRVVEDGRITGYRINGSKQWISNGGIADAYTVLANTPGGPSLVHCGARRRRASARASRKTSTASG